VTWEENDGVPDDDTTRRQIFVAKALKQALADTPCPPGTKPAGGNNLNGFCWQQVGLERLNPNEPTSLATGDPTLNIDPTRSGVEPDIAFTGPNDTVAWVVWYEEDPTGIDGLRNNDMVFAARIVADATADGGFHWRAVGNGTAGQTNVLDTSARTASAAAPRAKTPRTSARSTRKPAGTRRIPGSPPARSRRRHDGAVGGLAGGPRRRQPRHLRLAPGRRRPLRALQRRPADLEHGERRDATRHHVLRQRAVHLLARDRGQGAGDVRRTLRGGPSAPVFKLDTPTGIPNSGFADLENPLRAPISSGCTANPFNADGASCQGGAIGTPFFLYTAGSPGAQQLFAQAFAPTDVSTLPRPTSPTPMRR